MAAEEEAKLLAAIEAAENRIAALQGLPLPHAKVTRASWSNLQATRTLAAMDARRGAERLLGSMFDLTGRAGSLRTRGNGVVVWTALDEEWVLGCRATLDCGPDASIVVLQQRLAVPSVFRRLGILSFAWMIASLAVWQAWTWGLAMISILTPAFILLALGGARALSQRKLERVADTLAGALRPESSLRVRTELPAMEEVHEDAFAAVEVERGIS